METTSTKKSAAKTPAAENAITLATICKDLKMEPRKARRILRTAKVKNPGRWAWATKAEASKIEKLLKDADSGE